MSREKKERGHSFGGRIGPEEKVAPFAEGGIPRAFRPEANDGVAQLRDQHGPFVQKGEFGR
jgi:hypothetical protein